MDATNPAAPAATGVSSGVEVEAGSEAAFQDLVDRGIFNEDAPPNRLPGDEERWSAEDRQKEPVKAPEKAQEAPEAEKPAEGTEKQAEGEEKSYESLDAYLKEANLEAEGFMQLPVTVKVDGAEQRVPLSELTKGYELRQASYNRMQEAARAREDFTREQAQVRQALGQQIQDAEGLLTYAQQQLLGDYNRIDWQKLRMENPAEYAALAQDYNQRSAAIQQHINSIRAKRQTDAQQAEQARLQAVPAERAKLLDAIPEWRDPAKFATAHKQIRDLATKVGFTEAELNAIYDHRYLRVLDMANRWAQLQAKAPATVNRVRTAPTMAKPGTRQVRDPQKIANQNLEERWARSGYRDDEAGAAIFDQF